MRPIATSAAVRVDTGILADYPLSKERIAVYNSGLVPIDRYRRDAPYIKATRPESLRIDLGWGADWMPWTREVVTAGVDGSLSFDFVETDSIATFLTECGVRPYWSYCYVPGVAQATDGDWRTMAADESSFVRTVEAYVAGARQRGVEIGYHEVYNEPDLRDERTGDATFYTGGLDDYLNLYRSTAPAIRAADPSARVGGPALALPAVNGHWLEAFLTAVRDEQLPLDFLSFHHYGHFGIENTLRIVREVLAGFPTLRHVELHLNEYNAFAIDYPRGGLQDGHHLASAFAAEIPRLLGHRDLTRTHWAQFLDSGNGNFSGMIDIDGDAKPLYEIYRFYQHMPIDRVVCAVDGPPEVGAVAGVGGGRTEAIMWNRHFTTLAVDLELVGCTGTVTYTLIGPEGIDRERSLTLTGSRTRIAIPAGAVVLLHHGAAPLETGDRQVRGIQVVTGHRAGWTDLDETDAVFRFGTGEATDTDEGWLVHGIELPPGIRITDWRVQVRTADGTRGQATVVVDHGGLQRTLAGAGDAPWAELLADLTPPAASDRAYVAVTGPAGVFVTVTAELEVSE